RFKGKRKNSAQNSLLKNLDCYPTRKVTDTGMIGFPKCVNCVRVSAKPAATRANFFVRSTRFGLYLGYVGTVPSLRGDCAALPQCRCVSVFLWFLTNRANSSTVGRQRV